MDSRSGGRNKSQRSQHAPLLNDIIPFEHARCLAPSKVVDLFLESFKYVLSSDDLSSMIQTVKGELFNRDYLSAFNSDDKRFAYAARWSPARALAYGLLFASCDEIADLLEDPDRESKVLCVGGGAASELIGFASTFAKLKQPNGGTPSSLHLNIVDIADWSTIVGNLTKQAQESWFYDGLKFQTLFIHGDVLTFDANTLELAHLDLVTLLFTTNELFSEKRTETIRFLQSLCAHCKKGALLLIAESAGSYSNITIGLKQFPVQFLIDTILVGKPGSSDGKWDIVQQSESCWYRINDTQILYPVKLENMRFFYRLYRKK